ncbi:hypothetical protein [Nostoc sp. MG11]|uniref:hypothetical protein n=1 Tax=Nostoc sp. MG11 TaxID=2721166 RepID=UPI0018690510|nr:hypothetical protein [Nostoc sp. MG11]
MTSLQTQTSQPPTLQPLQDAWQRWWTTLSCQTNELWQTVTSRDTSKIYKEAVWKTWQIFTQFARLLLLVLLSIVGGFLFVWLLGFHTGRGFRIWLEADNPTPTTILKKFVAVLLLPFQLVTIWVDRTLKQAFGWDLKLTQLLPEPDPELLPQKKNP